VAEIICKAVEIRDGPENVVGFAVVNGEAEYVEKGGRQEGNVSVR
jgi:hypothetical protein